MTHKASSNFQAQNLSLLRRNHKEPQRSPLLKITESLRSSSALLQHLRRKTNSLHNNSISKKTQSWHHNPHLNRMTHKASSNFQAQHPSLPKRNHKKSHKGLLSWKLPKVSDRAHLSSSTSHNPQSCLPKQYILPVTDPWSDTSHGQAVP